jgi:hypothetical protein
VVDTQARAAEPIASLLEAPVDRVLATAQQDPTLIRICPTAAAAVLVARQVERVAVVEHQVAVVVDQECSAAAALGEGVKSASSCGGIGHDLDNRRIRRNRAHSRTRGISI